MADSNTGALTPSTEKAQKASPCPGCGHTCCVYYSFECGGESDAVRECERDRRELAESTLMKVRDVLIEWGMDLEDQGDFAEGFAEAIQENGAWRLARDLRGVLPLPPGGESRG